MKKLLLALILLLPLSAYVQTKPKSQKSVKHTVDNIHNRKSNYGDTYVDPFKEKKESRKKEFLAMSNTARAGVYMNKSYNYQYGAIGCAGVSAGLLIGYGSLKDKFELNDNGKPKMTNKAKGLIIGGSIFAITAIALEISAINYKTKAGKCLQLQATENGAGLAFVF